MTIKTLNRQRAPSAKSLATRERILDAAEIIFARTGFDGATIRDIAAECGEPVSLIHHHGQGKERLFEQVIARRADDLSKARQAALQQAKAGGPLDLESILRAFLGPYLTLAGTAEHWRAYARLVAYVSADERWRELAHTCFDPTAALFMDEIVMLFPDAPRQRVATGFILAISSMLALTTARWRIDVLGAEDPQIGNDVEFLIGYCAAGIRATAEA